MGWVVSITPRPRFTPGERSPGTHWTGGWVGPRAGLDAEARRKIVCLCRGSNPGCPVRSQLLCWLSYPGSLRALYNSRNCLTPTHRPIIVYYELGNTKKEAVGTYFKALWRLEVATKSRKRDGIPHFKTLCRVSREIRSVSDSEGNSGDSYSECPGLKSRPGDRLSWLQFYSWFSSLPPGKCRASTLN
jgi:hypothetical protein